MKRIVLVGLLFLVVSVVGAQQKAVLPSELKENLTLLVKKLGADDSQERKTIYNDLLKTLKGIKTCQTLTEAVELLRSLRKKEKDAQIKDMLEELFERPVIRFCVGADVVKKIPNILDLLTSKKKKEREEAVNLLYEEVVNGSTDYIYALFGILRGGGADIRMFAAIALGKSGEPAVKPLIKALEDEHSWVRKSAAYALGKIGDKRAVEPLINVLKDEDWRVRGVATGALNRITGQDFGTHYDKWLNWFKEQK